MWLCGWCVRACECASVCVCVCECLCLRGREREREINSATPASQLSRSGKDHFQKPFKAVWLSFHCSEKMKHEVLKLVCFGIITFLPIGVVSSWMADEVRRNGNNISNSNFYHNSAMDGIRTWIQAMKKSIPIRCSQPSASTPPGKHNLTLSPTIQIMNCSKLNQSDAD